MPYKQSYKSSSRFFGLKNKRLGVVIAVVTLVIITAGIGLHYKKAADDQSVAQATRQSTATAAKPLSAAKSQAASSEITTSGSGATHDSVGGSSSSDKSSTTSVDPATPLKAPYGEFVSAHILPSGGEKQPQYSICRTTPGASCSIIFTQGDSVKSLPTKTADSEGAASWDKWIPSELGLTSGSWTITAKATLGTQNSQTTDETKMVLN